MDNPEKKPIIGILGGIGSGKSSVASHFAKLGCAVIDADKIAHEILAADDVKKNVINRFGNRILDRTEQIDRHKLAEIVFNNSQKLSELNKILHPPVLAQIEQLIAEGNNRPDVKAIVLDMPLLAETGWDKRCDYLIFVDCKEQIRADRARKIGVLRKKELKIRENFQISLDKKKKLSDNTVDNNSGFSALISQVEDAFSFIMDKN